jgi:membrane protease YdiL (CAAX protease family)
MQFFRRAISCEKQVRERNFLMTSADLSNRSGRSALGSYLALWAIAVFYLWAKGADWTFPFASLVIFGGVFSGLGWWLTGKMDAPVLPVTNPKRESRALLWYLAIYALVIFGWLYGALKAAIPPGPTQEIAVMAFKLIVSVALPSLILYRAGGSVRPMWDGGTGRPGFWRALAVLSGLSFALLSTVSPALAEIGALHLPGLGVALAIAGAWLWVSLEAGLCEEYLFRAGLQSRLSAWLQSPIMAIVTTSILFALTHVPGLWLRGTPDTEGFSSDLVQVAAFTIATLSPISIAFGILWARSRSLLLVVLVHGAIDALPFTSEFVKIWF